MPAQCAAQSGTTTVSHTPVWPLEQTADEQSRRHRPVRRYPARHRGLVPLLRPRRQPRSTTSAVGKYTLKIVPSPGVLASVRHCGKAMRGTGRDGSFFLRPVATLIRAYADSRQGIPGQNRRRSGATAPSSPVSRHARRWCVCPWHDIFGSTHRSAPRSPGRGSCDR